MEDVGSTEGPGPPSLLYRERQLVGRLLSDSEQLKGFGLFLGVQLHREGVGHLMDHVDDKEDVRDAHGDKLHQPEAEEWNRRKQIVAHVGAARLDGVAHKSLLLILVERITGEEEDQDTEEDHHDEPHLSCGEEKENKLMWLFNQPKKTEITPHDL